VYGEPSLSLSLSLSLCFCWGTDENSNLALFKNLIKVVDFVDVIGIFEIYR
jgi:hypothetical protein